ncbi:MAG: hypothetical protein RLZZ387_2800 [Chloroflexota bacterium]|jgi:hypothetical protein
MSTFAERIATVETPVVNDAAPTTPAIWWYNGNKQAKTPGVFYVKGTALQQEPAEPWAPSARFDNETGFETSALHLAPITWRQQPYRVVEVVSNGTQRKDRRYLTDWEPGAQIHTEIVCLAAGIAEPVVWSFHGMTGRAVMGKSGIFNSYRHGLLRGAEKVAGKRLPLWTFWLPITTLRNAKGQITYTDTGHGSLVTLPMLDWPTAPEPELIDTLFVGEEWVAYGYEVRRQFESWRTQRRGTNGAANGTGATNGHTQNDEAIYDEEEVPL